MKTIRLIFILCLVQNLWGENLLYAQTKDFATIYVYRPKKLVSSAIPAHILFNDIQICQLENSSKLKYQIYSEGKLNISVYAGWGKDAASLSIISGETYYICVDLSFTGAKLIVNPPNSNVEYDRIPEKKLISMVEDLSTPAIGKPLDIKLANTSNQDEREKSRYDEHYSYKATPDIGVNIPINQKVSEYSFALIIGNEDYSSFQTDLSSEMNVLFARNDASLFKEYSIKTLGIPEKNIIFLLDATYGQMSQAISKINLISRTTQGKATIYFYYAGHGLPDETTKEPYLMPVDISGSNVSSAIKLNDVLFKLTEHPNKRVIVFLDACFSGGAREQSLIAARAVRVEPKEEVLKGNIMVFASSSSDQLSLPFREKQHGLFSYFLLKKIQETGGQLTLKELSDYLTEKVSLESILVNSREQTPKTNISHDIESLWQKWYLIENY